MRVVLDRNLLATILTCQAVARGMMEMQAAGPHRHHRRGRRLQGPHHRLDLCGGQQAGMTHYTRCPGRPASGRLRHRGGNCIAPGDTRTGRFLGTRAVEREDKNDGHRRMRIATVDEVARVVGEFFAGPQGAFWSGQRRGASMAQGNAGPADVCLSRADQPNIDFAGGAAGYRFRSRVSAAIRWCGRSASGRAAMPAIVDATAGLGRDGVSSWLAGAGGHLDRARRRGACAAEGGARPRRGRVNGPCRSGRPHDPDPRRCPRACCWSSKPDVVIVDPMHPLRQNTALVKKEMRRSPPRRRYEDSDDHSGGAWPGLLVLPS